MRQWHTSPFEQGEVKFHLKVPIFVERQLTRHRTAKQNQYSGRYSEMSDEFYLPELDYLQSQTTTNKQGRDGELVNEAKHTIRQLMKDSFTNSYSDYLTLLHENPDYDLGDNDGQPFPGIARELARIVLPVANYTELYWKCDLHNFFHYCRLRMDSHAQREIRDFAGVMYNLVVPFFPLSCQAFEDYRFHAKTLSRMDLLALADMLSGTFVASADHYGMSKREYSELVDLFSPTSAHSRNLITT
jgi:thymidylate synthase (FAD)